MERRDWFGRVAQAGLGGGAMLGMVDAAVSLDPDGGAPNEAMRTVEDELCASGATLTPAITLDVPAAAWTGALVAVRIDARALPNVRRLYLLRNDHIPAVIASLTLAGKSRAAAVAAGGRATDLPALVSLPVRIEKPCLLRVLALTDAGWFRQDARVHEVGVAGCGLDSDASSR